MPTRVRRFNTRKPRRGKTRKRKPYRRAATLVKGPSPVSDSLFTRLKYSDTFVTAATATPVGHIFRTSAYQPDYTLGAAGHQPMGYDQWSLFYNKYRVWGIKYEIHAINTSTTSANDVVIVTKPASTAIADPKQLWETAYARPRIIGVEGGNSRAMFKGYMNAAKVLGVTKLRYGSDDVYTANTGANPGVHAYLHMYSQPSDLTTTSTVRWKVNFTYYIQFFDRHTLGIS